MATAFASIGLIMSTVYALWLVQAAFLGREREATRIPDLNLREMAAAPALPAAVVGPGLSPNPIPNRPPPLARRALPLFFLTTASVCALVHLPDGRFL